MINEKYTKLIEDFLSKNHETEYKIVFLNSKKYKETSIKVPSYEYYLVDLIVKYLENKADFVEPIYNYKNNWDYCTIFIHKLIE